MKKYIKLVGIIVLTIVCTIFASSFTRVEVGPVACIPEVESEHSVQDGFSIERVHYNLMYDMNIYEVRTPKGTYYVLWEKTKGGLCTLH